MEIYSLPIYLLLFILVILAGALLALAHGRLSSSDKIRLFWGVGLHPLIFRPTYFVNTFCLRVVTIYATPLDWLKNIWCNNSWASSPPYLLLLFSVCPKIWIPNSHYAFRFVVLKCRFISLNLSFTKGLEVNVPYPVLLLFVKSIFPVFFY